jgi:membrane fusion protein
VSSRTSIFRQEAIDASRGEWLGSITVAAPISRSLLAALAFVIAMSALLFLGFSHYTRRETVAGQIVPSAGLLNLAATTTGTVTRIWVQDGQTVRHGDALFEVSSEQDSAALGETHALLGQQLDIQQKRLQEDLQVQATITQDQVEALRQNIDNLRGQMGQIGEQIKIQQQKVESEKQLLERIRPLRTEGYVSALQIQQQQTTVYDVQADYEALLRQKLQIQQQIDTAQQQMERLPLDAAAKRHDTERQLATVSQSMAQNELQRAVVLRAPRDGIVSATLLKEGQMVQVGQPVMSLLPAGSELQAQLLVASRAVGFVRPGNDVVLRYPSYPYQKFGQQHGKVLEVSRSALTPSEVQALVGKQTSVPLYRIQVSLDHPYVMAYGSPERIKPGMEVDADILLERRTLLEWVFEPLYGMTHHVLGAAGG